MPPPNVFSIFARMNNDAPSGVPVVAVAGTTGQAAATGAADAGILARSGRLWNRDFALLWQGQLVSSIGKQAFALTCMLAIKDLTGSGSTMGLLMAFAIIPSVALGPLAGVFVDRVDRRRLIAYTDIAGGLLVLAAAAAVLLWSDRTPVVIAALFAVTIATGILDTCSQPAISSSLPDIVPRDRLEAANGLNMGSVQAAVFVAQGASGVLYKALGSVFVMVLNAFTYLYAGVAELFVRLPRPERSEADDGRGRLRQGFRDDLRDGFAYVVRHRGLFVALLSFAAMNFFAAPLLVTFPFLAQDYYGLGPEWYGYMMAAFGAGAIAGYGVVAIRPMRGRSRAVAMAVGMFVELVLILVALARLRGWAAVALFLGYGVVNGIINVNVMTLIQMTTPRELLGRVNALSGTLAGAAMPLGMALGGLFFDLSGQNIPLMLIVSAASLSACTVAPLIGSRAYRSFLSTES